MLSLDKAVARDNSAPHIPNSGLTGLLRCITGLTDLDVSKESSALVLSCCGVLKE